MQIPDQKACVHPTVLVHTAGLRIGALFTLPKLDGLSPVLAHERWVKIAFLNFRGLYRRKYQENLLNIFRIMSYDPNLLIKTFSG